MQLQTMYPSQNNSPHAETSAVITAAETQIEVNDATILPDAPNVLTLGTEEDAELVLMTAKTENILVVTRGYNGTTAKAWDAGTWIYRGISTDDLDALQNNIEALNEGKLESVGTDDVNDEAITNAKLATMATGTIKGNAAAEAAAPADLSAADVRRLLNVADGADVTDTAVSGSASASSMDDGDTIVVVDSDGADGSKVKRVTPSVLKSALGSDLPAGGDAGQALIKSSAEDYDTEWGLINTQNIEDGAVTGAKVTLDTPFLSKCLTSLYSPLVPLSATTFNFADTSVSFLSGYTFYSNYWNDTSSAVTINIPQSSPAVPTGGEVAIFALVNPITINFASGQLLTRRGRGSTTLTEQFTITLQRGDMLTLKKITGNATGTSEAIDWWLITADVLQDVYPVGSIYMSVNSTSPALLFGGTWEQIKDTFLLAAGEAYAAGAAGGEATHMLTTDELPNIYGSLTVRTFRGGSNLLGVSNAGNLVSYTSKGGELWSYGVSGGETTTKGDLLSFAVGGDAAHNNMPPYLAVYMWQRTA